MIVTVRHPEAPLIKVYDKITNELVGLVVSVNTDTGEAWQYKKEGNSYVMKDGELEVFKYPNKVRVEFPK